MGLLSVRQLTFMLITSKIASALLLMPPLGVEDAAPSIWLAIPIAAVFQGLFYLPVYVLSKRWDSQGVMYGIGRSGGKIIMAILTGLYAVYFIFLGTLSVNLGVIFTARAMMPKFSIYGIALVLMFTVLYGSYKGLHPIARGCEFFVGIALAVIAVLALSSTSSVQLSYLQPFWKGTSVSGALKYGLCLAAGFQDSLIYMFLAHKQTDKKKRKSVILLSQGVFFAVYLVLFWLSVGVLGMKTASTSRFPYFTLNTVTNVYHVIEKMELIAGSVLLICLLLQGTIFIYLAKRLLKKIHPRLGIVAFVAAGIIFITFGKFSLYAFFLDMVESHWSLPALSIFFAVVIPCALLFLDGKKRKK